MDWKKISINKFKQISDITKAEMSDTDKLFKLIETVFDVDNVSALPLKEYNKYVSNLDFLKQDVKPGIVHDKYRVGDYKCRVMTIDYTVAQYSDYMAYLQQDNQDFVNLISCVLVPEGHEYGEGYDLIDFKKQIGEHMSVVDATSICFFFKALYVKTVKRMLRSLEKEMQKEKRQAGESFR